MLKFKQFLVEKTFRLGQDVDMIYKNYFAKYMKDIRSDKWDGRFKVEVISSAFLKSADSKKAHKLNPIHIVMNSKNESGNFYNPISKYISLKINDNALEILKQANMNFNDAGELLSGRKKEWMNDLSENRIKGTIYHELSHWIDDSIHNQHIEKMLIKAHEPGHRDVLKQGSKGVNSSYYEINAQVHAVKQIKRQMSKSKYDSLTFDELVAGSSALTTMTNLNKDAGSYDQWRKDLLKRLSREKLLGKSMKFKF